MRRHADVTPRVQFAFIYAAILRKGFLVGLEPGEEFDAAKHTLREFRRQSFGWAHHAIEPERN